MTEEEPDEKVKPLRWSRQPSREGIRSLPRFVELDLPPRESPTVRLPWHQPLTHTISLDTAGLNAVGAGQLVVVFVPIIAFVGRDSRSERLTAAACFAACGLLVAVWDGAWRLKLSDRRGVLRWLSPVDGGWLVMCPGWVAGMLSVVLGMVVAIRVL